jgi:predicted amidohydrolase YtcJ
LAVAHAESVAPEDVPRFAKLDVQPAMGLQWAEPSVDASDGTQQLLGPERFALADASGTLYRAGAKVALGSDWPVDPLDEWLAIQIAITRQNHTGEAHSEGTLGDSPGLSRAEAIRTATINAARVMHQEMQTGSLETGKFADLIVLDRNIMRTDVDKIYQTKVLVTMVGGNVVYGKLW